METLLEKELKEIEKELYNDDFPIGFFGVFGFALVAGFLLGFTYEWKSFTFLEGFQNVVLLLVFAVYFGRQLTDLPWIYLVLSFKKNYQTIAEKQKISFDSTKHVARTIFLLVLTPILYSFNDSVHFSWTLPLFCFSLLFPIFYRILANKKEQNIEAKIKKNPVQRISVDGKVDLSHLPFVFENLETHAFTNEKVKKAYLNVQSLLDYDTMHVKFIDDVEIVHTLKRMGEEELPRLLNEYETLEQTLQADYVEKVLAYLNLIEKRLVDYKTMIDEKKTQHIQTTFSLLDERYRG